MGQENPRQEQSCSSESYSLKQAIEVVSSLITFSYDIKVFAVKWKMLRNKLEELNSCLIAIENCDSSQNPIRSGLISAIIIASNNCYDLAKRCVDLSYSGKLLMQSDLDVMAATVDRLIKNLSGICTAGVLTQGFAIVVSKPAANSCRDDMRFYIRDLLTRTKIGDAEMKKQAVINLYEAVVEDERYVKVILEVGDTFHILGTLLDSPEMEIQEQAAKVISVVSKFDSCKSVLILSGVIGSLVKILEIGSELAKAAAATSLQKLTENSDNAWSVCAHGGVTALLKLCSNGDSSSQLIGPACGVLRNVVGVEEIKRFMIEDGAISRFIKLARSKDESVQVYSIDFLQKIASGDESVKQLVVREGGIRALVHLLDPKTASTYKSREIALMAIENLCFSSANYTSMLITYGFIDQLHFFLRNGDVSDQELALKVACRLCRKAEEAKKAMADAGFMSEFVRFLDAKSFEVREMASGALTSMVSIPKNRKRFLQDDRNIKFLLQLLDQDESNSGDDKKFLISILISLTSSNSGRRKIVNSGYLKNIEKLAEAEVSDAKRLVRKLSANRFRSILSGFWNSSV